MAEEKIVDAVLACKRHLTLGFDRPYVVARCRGCRRTLARCICPEDEACQCVRRLRPVFKAMEGDGEQKMEVYLVVMAEYVFKVRMPVTEFVWQDSLGDEFGKGLYALVDRKLATAEAVEWGVGPYYRFRESGLLGGGAMRRHILSEFLNEWLCEKRRSRPYKSPAPDA